MMQFNQFLVEKDSYTRTGAKAVGDAAEKEAADILRKLLPHHYKVSFGRGKTAEGGDAPDIIVHTEHHVHHSGGKTRMKDATPVAHAIMTRKKSGKWAFTVVAHHKVHSEVRKHAPEISHGVRMSVRKRPGSTQKNPTSSNFGKADVHHAVSIKPTSVDSVPHVTFHEHGEVTNNGHALAAAIQAHVEEHGAFVIDIKSGGGTQMSNMSFNAHRESEHHAPKIEIGEKSSFPKHTQEKLSAHVMKHAGHHIHEYLNQLGHMVGRPIHSTRYRKYRKSINGTDIHPRDDLDIPESQVSKVKFHHVMGTEQEAAEAARLMFDRTASGYEVEEHHHKE